MPESAPHSRRLLLGTRGSQLARWQADWVARRLEQLGQVVELVEISTHGDLDQGQSIEEIGTRGAFTKEIQRALLAGEVDLAVHSLKDLPTEPVAGLHLAAVPPRESPADVLVASSGFRIPRPVPVRDRERGLESTSRATSHEQQTASVTNDLEILPHGACVGTGSLRRQAQLLNVRPDLNIKEIRGNVDTRLRKLDDGQFDAIVLAEAGLRRLGLVHRISSILPFQWMLPAAGQGALAIECRADDDRARAAIATLDDPATHAAVLAERALLAHLRGGCMAPVGAIGRFIEGLLHLKAVVLAADGSRRLAAEKSLAPADWNDAEQLGRQVADELLLQGAAQLIQASRTGHET